MQREQVETLVGPFSHFISIFFPAAFPSRVPMPQEKKKKKGGGRLTASSLVSLHWVGAVNKYAGLSHRGRSFLSFR